MSARQDALARRLAQSLFDRPLVVEAGAGTGKTATLVARVLCWALGPGWERGRRDAAVGASSPPGPDEIASAVMGGVVAITFTDAAAAEMATRVGEGLLQVARGAAPVGLAADLLPEDPAQRQLRAVALLGALDALEVRTIHAFSARLLQEHAVSAGLHPAFGVDADGEQRARACREVVEEALVEGLGEAPDPDLLDLASEGIGPASLVAATSAFLEQGVDPAELDGDPFAPEHSAVLCSQLRQHLDATRVALVPIVGGKGRTNLRELAPALEEVAEQLGPEPGIEAAVQVARALVDDHASALGKLRSGRLTATELKLVDPPEPLKDAGGALARLLLFLARLDPARTRQVLRVVAPLLAGAHQRLRARGSLGFSELLVEAARLLRDRPAVGARVRQRLRQLLVDEFQDTDPLQCEIVSCLALDGPAESRPGLFIVGDPKQSIYGWRRADLQAYEEFVQQVVAQGGQRVSLTVNFRSVPAVLDAVEGAMRRVMRPRRGWQPEFQRLLACDKLAQAPGFHSASQAPVELWVPWAWQDQGDLRMLPDKQTKPPVRQVEAAAVARDIAALGTQGVAWKDIAVLFRTTGDLPALVQALRDAGVPYAVERDRSYFQRREVFDAISLVAAVADPHDHVSLLGWLRSAVVGVPDAALLPLWRQGFPQAVGELQRPGSPGLAQVQAMVDRAAAEVGAMTPPIPGLERVSGWAASARDALARLAALRRSLAEDPVDRFVALLRSLSLVELTEAARYQGPWRLANLDRFFRGLQEGLAEGGDIHAVLRVLREGLAGERQGEEGRPQEAAADAVQLMTIHKSKGLGFDHVYVVGLDKAGMGDRAGADQVVDGRAWSLLGAPSPGLLASQERSEAVGRAEGVRLLYVAMTRARQRLVLSGLWPALPEPPDLDAVTDGISLLSHWNVVPSDLALLAGSLPPGQEWADRDGLRWVFPGRWADVVAAPAAQQAAPLPSPGLVPLRRVLDDARALSQDSQQARLRMARPWTEGLSAGAHDQLHALLAAAAEATELPVGLAPPGGLAPPLADGEPPGQGEPGQGEPGPEGAPGGPPPPGALPPGVDPQELATLAGTAVHGVLERLDLSRSDLAAALAEAAADLDRWLLPQVEPAVGAAAVARARGILGALAESRTLARLARVAEHVVARELDVLLPPAAEAGPVGARVGAIDLVYMDMADGSLVVADYKTDDVSGPELDARARAYAPQILAYAQALQRALALHELPRQELWFLRADVVVIVES